MKYDRRLIEKFLTKNNVLFISVFGSILLIISMYPTETGICGVENRECWLNFDFFQDLISIFPVLFVFSLVTYKMRDEVFHHWMNFTVCAVPILIVLTYLITSEDNGGLGIESAYGDSFDTLLFFLLYGAFIGVSIYRIASKHREVNEKR